MLLGHNGMGKTTLMRTLMGLVRATDGSIVFDGAEVTRESPHRRARRGLGYVPQGREIFPRLSVIDNLRMAAAAAGETSYDAVDAVLRDFPRLRPMLDREGAALSGGEQQILAIARCLCHAAAADAARRADRGYPAVDRRADRGIDLRPETGAQSDRGPGRAEPGFRGRAVGSRLDHPEG